MSTAASPSVANPLLLEAGLPRFDLFRPEQVEPGVREALARMERGFAALEAEVQATLAAGGVPTWDGFGAKLARVAKPWSRSWNVVSHMQSVMDSEPLRAAHDLMQPEVVAFGLRCGQSKPVYQGLKALRNHAPTWDALPRVRQRIVESRLRDMELAGVGLEGAARERFLAIEKELAQAGTDFSNHVLDATKAYGFAVVEAARTEGWPTVLKQMAAAAHNRRKPKDAPEATPEAGPWCITLDGPLYMPFMEHHRHGDDRRTVWLAMVSRATDGAQDNTALVERLLALKAEKAALLGFPAFAALSLSAKMAGAEAVRGMYDELVAASKPAARREYDELCAFALERGHAGALEPWDAGFFAERLREAKYAYTEEEIRPYFPVDRVIAGLFGLCTRLFGVTFRRVADGAFPTWHPDVRYYEVVGEAGSVVAGFYLDLYARPGLKRGGAWMNECLGRHLDAGELQLPVVHLICNGTPPSGDTPSLMGFDEIITLFHEFGHGLQGMLTTVDESDAAGLGCMEWDAVEIASQFMENWCYDRPTLLGMSAHWRTGEPLPEALFEKIKAAATYRAGSAFIRQLLFGLVDLHLHGAEYRPGQPEGALAVYRRFAADLLPRAPKPEDRFLNAFTHIFAGGYSAGYYSYKWSEVYSADAFAAFEEAGLSNEAEIRRLGRRYRDTILGMGGGEHPAEVYRLFRGQPASAKALLRHNGLA